MKKLVLAAIFAVVFFMCSGTVYGAYYGVYDIRGPAGPDEQPLVDDFQWVDRTYTYQSGDMTFSVDFTLYAPNSWSSLTDPNGNSYNSYIDPLKGSNNLYSYYYKVTYESGTGNLNDLTIPYSPASLINISTAGDSGQGITIGNNPVSQTAILTFDQYGMTGGGPGLEPGTYSQSFYMTSEYWWGWQPITLNGGTAATGSTYLSSIHNSPEGMLPAPNPEASTVALYIVGLIGMGTLYYRKKKMAEMEV